MDPSPSDDDAKGEFQHADCVDATWKVSDSLHFRRKRSQHQEQRLFGALDVGHALLNCADQ